ncbi:ABC transporter ATP-binding protein [Rhodothermus bifroesti]|uniref:ABC transporter ATP-binding protein n=1 Tax=Rhodothermus bifroesti TaxID=2823335 RepID=UPI001AF0101E|nr:ABC transporter ATP-binding protein [Rhodothermus bifroesti]
MATPIEVHRVTKRFGTITALHSVSLEVREGEMFGLVGPDGAGKTTLLRLLAGIAQPDEGVVRVLGHDLAHKAPHIRPYIGYMSQRFSLYADLTVAENLRFFARMHGTEAERTWQEQLLEMTGLAPFRHRLAEHLSGGMKQKLALICTLVYRPRLLLLDEPTTGVDPVARRQFWQLLVQFQQEGLTIVLATPYLDEAERCQRVGLMHHGHLLALDTPQALRAALPGRLFELTATPIREAARRLRSWLEPHRVQLIGNRIHLLLDSETALEGLCHRLESDGSVRLSACQPIAPTLENVFLAYLLQEEQKLIDDKR